MGHSRERQWLRFVVRVLVIWAIEAIGLLVMAWLLPSVHVSSLLAAVLAVAVIGLLNAVMWPILSYLILPFAVLTLGLASLVLNGALVLLADSMVTGLRIDSLFAAIILTLGLTAINTIVSSLLTIDDDRSWYRNVVRRRMRQREPQADDSVPGVLFLEIDGLSRPVLERAIADGRMPTLARWLSSGTHRLAGWETDLSSQTSASQAGILQGSNDNIPAFRWWDRTAEQIVASSSPRELARLEQELSDGRGLLAENGASRGNMFSGDAPDVMLTASTATDLSRFHTSGFYAYFVDPYNFSRTLLLTLWEIVLEIWEARRARREEVYPILGREERGGKYPVLRAFMTVVLRELTVYTLIGDVFASVPTAYATLAGYDEVAHHSGVESPDALDILSKLDRQLGRIESACGQAPRPYHLVVLSDHGQSSGATFKQRYGMTLEQFVGKLATDLYRVRGDVAVHEDWKHVNVFLTETIQHDREVVRRPVRRLLRRHTRDGHVGLGPGADQEKGQEQVRTAADESTPHIVALASGNLGLIYSSRRSSRATLEEIEEAYPHLLEGLAKHEGIGFVMVRSRTRGPVVIGPKGRHYLADGGVEGEDPLARFGAHAPDHLRRTDCFAHAPDILVNSFYDPQANEVAAFEELIGSHGGLGGWQTQPFLLYPAEWQVGPDEIVGAEALHRVLKGWLQQLAASHRRAT
jgi:uncharacterized membrane protein YvlD (DUF360 family)